LANEDDFEAMFDRMMIRAFRVAHRIIGDITLAEDIAAEALARAFSRWPELREYVYRDAWILRVATNLAVDAARRPKQPALQRDSRVDVEEVATVRAALAAALKALPRRQREAVALRYLADLPDDEIAATMDISQGAVKSHIARGVAALRQRLGSVSIEGGRLDVR
jgi:RNA polymerase sigma factor (sigma-70 family)